MQPTLYLVPTPIGNLTDFSENAKTILNDVSLVICEDTRHTLKLLSHFKIKAKLESLHLANEDQKTSYIIEKILSLNPPSAALVSDAGTPCVSDPGEALVNAAHNEGIKIISVPGPSSLTCAMAASGMMEKRKLFCGFLERSEEAQKREFETWLKIAPCAVYFFESPQRVIKTLENLKDFYHDPSLEILLSRELSKIHEENFKGTIDQVLEHLTAMPKIYGEFVIAAHIKKQHEILESDPIDDLKHLIQKEPQLSLKDAVKKIAKKHSCQTKLLYNRWLELTTKESQ